MNVKSSIESLFDLCRMLDSEDKVFFTRFGDNDIMMMSGTDNDGNHLGEKSYGGNKTVFSEELQRGLVDSFTVDDPAYLKAVSNQWDNEPGMAEGVFESFPYKDELAQKVRQLTDEDEFYLPVLFHYLFVFNHEAFELFLDKYIRGKSILYIGSTNKDHVERIIGKVDHYIETQVKGAFDDYERVTLEVEHCLNNNDVDIVIPSCGQLSRVLQFDLWNHEKGFHSIDMGSIFDVFEDEATRTWIRKTGNKIRARYGDPLNENWDCYGEIIKKEITLESIMASHDYKSQKDAMIRKLHKDRENGYKYKLGILIPSLFKRSSEYNNLIRKITRQIVDMDLIGQVKFYSDIDGGLAPIGSKRNSLLLMQECEYVVFLDDDDDISNDWLKLIWDAIKESPDVVTFDMSCNYDGEGWMRIKYSIFNDKGERIKDQKEHRKLRKDGSVDRFFLKPPGHLCPMKSSIALRYPHPVYKKKGAINRKQRNDNASEVHVLLNMANDEVFKNSVHIDKQIYHYEFKTDK